MQICTQLVETTPDAFNQDLARTLVSHSYIMANIGLKKEALQPIQQAVDIYKALASKYPAAHKSDFVQSMMNLSLRLSELDVKGEVMKIGNEVTGHPFLESLSV